MLEPTHITAGNAVSWTRDTALADGASVFAYRLVGPAAIDIATTADAGVITVDVDSTTTAAWAAGEYRWFLFRTVGTDRTQIADGYIVVDPDPSALQSTDNRSHAERMLELIDAKLEGRISSDHERYSIDGRSLDRIPVTELRNLRKQYAWDAYNNQVARGLRKRHKRIRHR